MIFFLLVKFIKTVHLLQYCYFVLNLKIGFCQDLHINLFLKILIFNFMIRNPFQQVKRNPMIFHVIMLMLLLYTLHFCVINLKYCLFILKLSFIHFVNILYIKQMSRNYHHKIILYYYIRWKELKCFNESNALFC
mmetsp:Transcript_18789/g.1650  ORF Transcript_18789/g.1650 Transcript_18789/m.1650 type:complete len:135 (+) Transcript_18789:105-509(+)